MKVNKDRSELFSHEDRRRSGTRLTEFISRDGYLERTRWYPKDGDLCLAWMKPEETLVEVRSDSDVQIDRQS